MVNIRAMINRRKEQFRSFKTRNQVSKIEAETENLALQKKHAGELARANAQLQKQKRDFAAIKEYNEKVQGPNKLKKFGQNLASLIDRGKTKVRENKAQGKTLLGTRSNFGSSSSSGGVFSGSGRGLDVGGRGLDVGGSNNNKFSFGPPERKMQRSKPKQIIIKL